MFLRIVSDAARLARRPSEDFIESMGSSLPPYSGDRQEAFALVQFAPNTNRLHGIPEIRAVFSDELPAPLLGDPRDSMREFSGISSISCTLLSAPFR